MFERYRTYFAYRQSILKWAKSVGYESTDVTWVHAWHTPTAYDDSKLVVSFGAPLIIDGFVEIFVNNYIAIYERLPADTKKIRYGVPDALFNALLPFVRDTATAHRKKQPLPNIYEYVPAEFHPYLEDDFTVDVGVWVDGQMRGSRLGKSRDIADPIGTASTHTVDDMRLKLVGEDELDKAIFEITFVPNVWIAVTANEFSARAPDHRHAVECFHGEEFASTYVPMVANQSIFPNARAFYLSLISKAGMRDDGQFHFVQAPTYTAVEQTDSTPLLLKGAYPKDADTNTSPETVQHIARHLMHNVDQEGFAQIIRNAQGKGSAKVDAARTAFLLYTLAEYYAITKDEASLPTINKLDGFLHALMDTGLGNARWSSMIKTYANTAYRTLGRDTDLLITEEELAAITQNHLCHTQYLKYAIHRQSMTEAEAKTYHTDIFNLFKVWQENQERISPVMFADLLILLKWSGLETEYQTFVNFLRANMAEDGSFPRWMVVYSRGISKLGESAAANTDAHDIAKTALRILRRMQYTDATMYHLPTNLRPFFKYGFRHDAWNRDLWLDGSSHALLLELRLVYASSYTTHLQKCLSAYTSQLPKSD